MSLLSELNTITESLDIPSATGVYKGTPPATYVVLVPMDDEWGVVADDIPDSDVQNVRISLYTKGSYTTTKNALIKAILLAGITITSRMFIERENDTGYFHYEIDCAQAYDFSLEDEAEEE